MTVKTLAENFYMWFRLYQQEIKSETGKWDFLNHVRKIIALDKKHEEFLKERTYILGTNGWRYTHRRVRSAHASLKKNLPFIFTYQKHPELNIPNTTNSLDGYFSRVKNLLSAHRGKNRERVRKIVTEILRK